MARQNKEKVSRRIDVADGGMVRQRKTVGKNREQLDTNIIYSRRRILSDPTTARTIQKRDPKTIIIENKSLTHGTAVKNFYENKNMQRGEKMYPDAPAWFANNNEAFSIHATLQMQNYKSIENNATRNLYVHIYRHNPMDLSLWNYWGEVPEQFIRNELYNSLDLSKQKQKIINYINRGKLTDEEKKAYCYALTSKNKYKIFGSNTKEAANEIMSKYGKDGYCIMHDRVRNEPEYILFDTGIEKLTSHESKRYKVERQNDTLYVKDDNNSTKYKCLINNIKETFRETTVNRDDGVDPDSVGCCGCFARRRQ